MSDVILIELLREGNRTNRATSFAATGRAGPCPASAASFLGRPPRRVVVRWRRAACLSEACECPMRLTEQEFRAMNSPIRRFFHRNVEFPLFRRLGLREEDQDILEIGCGSGYGAILLAKLRPRSYLGIDLMPEMIELAKKQVDLPHCEFLAMDASDMPELADESRDTVVTFGLFHHIPKWREVIHESYRVLRTGGTMFLEEPEGWAVRLWDRVFKWDHSEEAMFSMRQLEDHLTATGFVVVKRLRLLALAGLYCARKEESKRGRS